MTGMGEREDPVADDPEAAFDALALAMGAPALTPEERAAVLRLAKMVADSTERRFAPLSCYAAGLVIGAAGGDDGERLTRLRAFIDRVARRD